MFYLLIQFIHPSQCPGYWTLGGPGPALQASLSLAVQHQTISVTKNVGTDPEAWLL